MRTRWAGTLLLLGALLGTTQAEEPGPPAPGAWTDAIRALGLELPRVGPGETAGAPTPPYGFVALDADGRIRARFHRRSDEGLVAEPVGELRGVPREYVAYRRLRTATRAFSRRLGLVQWTDETTLPVVVALDRCASWLRARRVMGALEAAGVRRFLLAAAPPAGAGSAPVLLRLDLPRETAPYGGASRERVGISLALVAVQGASPAEPVLRVAMPDESSIPLGADVLAAAESVAKGLRAFVAASASDATPPWRIGHLDLDPYACEAVRCEHALPLAAVLLGAGLDEEDLGLEESRRGCLRPPGEPYASDAAYEAARRERRERWERRERFVFADDWLVAHQEEDGSWRHAASDGARHDLEVTALAVLRILRGGAAGWGAGPIHEALRRGLGWLRGQQGEDGVFRVEGGPDGRLGHALATLALVSAWSERPDPARRAGVVAALEALDAADGPARVIGAADVVTLLARYAARVANDRLGTRAEPLPWGAAPVVEIPDPRPAGWEQDATTWEVLHEVVRRMLGHGSRDAWRPDFVLRRVSQRLAERAPVWSEDGQGVGVLAWALTTVALWEQGGHAWKTWNSALYEGVIKPSRQHASDAAPALAGSWDPVGEGADRLGRVGTTATLGLLTEIYYHYE